MASGWRRCGSGASNQTGQSIVMLHEGLGSIALWKDFPEQLAARTGCGVLVYSRYGHGSSDKLHGEAASPLHASRRRSGVAGVAG